ncbi:uncharacterized protein LOC142225111 [Haematobia irritans]|uniref:uncharacterized protein LOC142225111 n=1 Tax=Haematobia irritans TaxID=7368 RepID=UPI003F50D2AC
MLERSMFPFKILLLLLISNVYHTGTHATKEVVNLNSIYDDKIHHLQKRMDLQICLGQFDVHKNTIIRTGESQAIGGKYLQGLELDTMEECQRLCCETESCDVYIFESKKDGYCYLFECGTPENFHCKFTRHANYTSAVLTPVIRHGIEVTTPHPIMQHKSSSGISQQEWELSNLKIKPEVREKPEEIGLPAIGAVNGVISNGSIKKSLGTDGGQETKVNASTQCGRFQFACHSGECIAIYNACDGIPQCEDGSDEGPECSGANNKLTSNPKSSPDATISNKEPANNPSLSQYQPTLMQQSVQQQLQSMQQPSHSVPATGLVAPIPMVNNREDPTVWETRKIVSGTPIGGVSGNNGGNPDLQNMNPLPSVGNPISDGFTAYVNNRKTNNEIYSAPIAPADMTGGLGTNAASTLEQSGLYVPHMTSGGANYSIPSSTLIFDAIPKSSNVLGNPDLQNMNPLPSVGNPISDGFTAYVNNRKTNNEIYSAPIAPADMTGGLGTNAASTLEQSGLYVPHMTVQDQNNVFSQQNILLPPPPPPPPAPLNSNWQQQAILNQQKKQQQLQQQQQQQNLPMSQQQQITLPQGPTYVMQTDGNVVSQQQAHQQSAQITVPSLAQQQQQQQQQQLQPQGDSKTTATGSLNPSSSLGQSAVKSDDSDEYDDSEEKSTEPPKKHKHKKTKSKSKDLQKTQEAMDEKHVNQLQQLQQQDVTATKTVMNSMKPAKTDASSPVHEQYEIIHQNMALEFRDHDGQSERPGGAVLSLTLGLLITAALAILIGCRMRTVGRRARRMGGKTPYSHEADFLVNGMYL